MVFSLVYISEDLLIIGLKNFGTNFEEITSQRKLQIKIVINESKTFFKNSIGKQKESFKSQIKNTENVSENLKIQLGLPYLRTNNYILRNDYYHNNHCDINYNEV